MVTYKESGEWVRPREEDKSPKKSPKKKEKSYYYTFFTSSNLKYTIEYSFHESLKPESMLKSLIHSNLSKDQQEFLIGLAEQFDEIDPYGDTSCWKSYEIEFALMEKKHWNNDPNELFVWNPSYEIAKDIPKQDSLEVLSTVRNSFLRFMETKPKFQIITFSAKEKSRQLLYDRFSLEVSKGLGFPCYIGFPSFKTQKHYFICDPIIFDSDFYSSILYTD